MSIKGHFMPCNDKMGIVSVGDFLPTWAGIGGGEIRGLEGRENAFGVFLSGNT